MDAKEVLDRVDNRVNNILADPASNTRHLTENAVKHSANQVLTLDEQPRTSLVEIAENTTADLTEPAGKRLPRILSAIPQAQQQRLAFTCEPFANAREERLNPLDDRAENNLEDLTQHFLCSLASQFERLGEERNKLAENRNLTEQLSDNPGARKSRLRIGRGIGSGKGKTGGRGGKGQTARTGVAINGYEGGQMPLHRRLPKRGFNNIFRLDFVEVNLDRIQQAIDAKLLDAGSVINAESLVKSRVVRRARDGVRLLGRGEIKAKVNIEVHGASKAAVAAVEKAGGTVKILAPAKKEEGEAA